MSSTLVSGFRHVGIIVKDMSESLHFYRDILGLEVIQDFTDDSDYINKIMGLEKQLIHMIKMKTCDNVGVELLQYKNPFNSLEKLPLHNPGICHVAFQIKNAENTYEMLSKHQFTVVSKPVLSTEKFAKVFFCIDPNNVRIECVEIINT